MPKSLRVSYQGWDITVCCTPCPKSLRQILSPSKYSAVGHARLMAASENSHAWIDPRPQTVTLGARQFDSPEECTELLLNDIKLLIDVLRKND